MLAPLMTGCASNSPNITANSSVANSQAVNPADSNAVKDDLEDFRQIVKLPFEPEEVVWREESPDGKKKTTAVLRFAPPDTEKIAAQAGTYRAGTPAVIETETWFPAELIAQSQLSGDETVKGTTYAANDFLQPPYMNGKLTRIENSDYFVLELTEN